MKSRKKIGFIGLITFVFLVFGSHPKVHGNTHEGETFICLNEGVGISAVDALESTGNHSIFLNLLQEHDNEGYEILTSPSLSDKTIWAPVDSAFEAIEDELNSMSSETIQDILGYHISPPLSRPNGDYPIVTYDYLKNNSPVTFRTRTGVLTGSDQRITANYVDSNYTIENVKILSTALCNEAGSVFSIDEVITQVEPPSWPTKIVYRAIRILFYEDIRFVIYSVVGSMAMGSGIAFGVTRFTKKDRKYEQKSE